MPNVTVYSAPNCPYCVRAKKLLETKNQPFTEIDISEDASIRDEMIEKAAGRRTVPQIFIDERHIGGFDDLNALDKHGELDTLLSA